MAVVERSQAEQIALGMVVLGLIFSSMLYGITLTQTHKYYHRFRDDPLFLKALVFIVFSLDTISVFLVGHACWYYLVTTGPSTTSIWSLNVEQTLSVVISGISETFLIFRVWQFSGRRLFLISGLLLLALVHFVSGEVAAVEFLLLKQFAKFNNVKVPTILRLSSACCCDTGIAISLSYFLQKKRTGFKRTDEIIDYLILFAINSGVATSMISIVCVITYIVIPKTWVYLAVCFLISRLYANTFLCSLNSRQILRASSGDDSLTSPGIQIRQRGRRFGMMAKYFSEKSPTQIDVFVVTETVIDRPDARGGSSNPDPLTVEADSQLSSASHDQSVTDSSVGKSSLLKNTQV